MIISKNSPLEHLTANALTFAAGALISLGLSAYVRHLKDKATAQATPSVNKHPDEDRSTQ